MNILKAKVDWKEGWDNDPDFVLLLDKIPSERRYEEIAPGFYYSNVDGFVSFMYHDPKNETGYGGAVFTLHMKDGSIRKIKGPWSSNISAVNEVGQQKNIEPCTEVVVTDNAEDYECGYTLYRDAVTLTRLKEAANMANVYLAEVEQQYGTSYVPCLRRTPPKGSAYEHTSIVRWRFIHPIESDWVVLRGGEKSVGVESRLSANQARVVFE